LLLDDWIRHVTWSVSRQSDIFILWKECVDEVKAVRKKGSTWLALLLAISLVVGGMPVTAFGEENELTYKFTHAGFPDRPTQEGWTILGELPGVPHTRYQVYGAQIQPTALNQFREFEFNVPETGYYTLSLSGYHAASGGLGAILVDHVKVGEYWFDGPAGYGPKNTLKTVRLTQGNHILKLQVIKKGTRSIAMYPSEFTLIKKEGPALVETVTAAPDSGMTQMIVGQTSGLLLDVRLDDGTAADLNEIRFAYESSDPSVISVSDAGTLTALQPGNAVILVTASKDGASRQAELPLSVLNGQLESITLTPARNPLVVGQTSAMTLTGTMDDGTAIDLNGVNKTFASSNADVATVDAAGTVRAVNPGTATVHVTAKLGSIRMTGTVDVTVVAKALESVALTVEPWPLMLGMHGTVTVAGVMNDGSPADIPGEAVTFRSSDETVLAVDAGGELRALALGSSTLTAEATMGTVTETADLTVEVLPVQNDKTRNTYYTPEEVAAARENIGLYDWAAAQRDAAVTLADRYVEKGLDFLWSSVPSQSLPRSYQTNQTLGNLSPLFDGPPAENPLNKLGNYPWQADPLNEPWKLTDPTTGYKFPTNDFGAYYRSGLDEHGVFDPAKADRSLLVNTLYPEKGSDWGVDDGMGWVDPETGRRYTFIAYYVHWYAWYSNNSVVQGGLTALRDAYLYTGDPKYAQAGTVLLDRVADMYPSLDVSKHDSKIYLNSHGGTGLGKAIGSIWETGLVKTFISAYDAFFPGMEDQAILDFLSAKGTQYDLPLKNSAAGIRKNVEDGILRETYKGFKNASIRGNNGFHQSALAMAAVVLDKNPETKEWLDYTFQTGAFLRNPDRITGGNILNTLVNDLDRDGNGNEAAPGYNRLWLSTYMQVADMLDGYDLYPAADLYQNVKFEKMFHAIYPMTMVERYTAQIGDSGSTGNVGTYLNKDEAIKAFAKYGDPIFAQIAYFQNNNSVNGIHSDIFTRNPNAIAQRIEQVIAEHGPFKLDSVNLTGYGFAALRDGEKPFFTYDLAYGFPQLPVTEATQGYTFSSASGALQFEATAPGERITFAFDVPETDRYEISLKPWMAASYGRYAIQIDGTPLAEFDFYGAGSEHRPIGELELTAGPHTITFEGVGKNAASTGYKMALIELALLDQAQQELRDASIGQNTLRDVWMYYGRNGGHGHRDALNIGLHAFGTDLMPDLGYPEQANATDAHRHEWVNNVISHNTVLVDRTKQHVQVVAQPQQYDATDAVQFIEVEAPNVYPQTDLYRRTTAMIRVDDANSYAVDFFRIRGGDEHHFSFHGAEGPVTTEGLNLTAQPGGTYAGEDVAFGVRPANDSVAGSGYTGPGFHWLKNVERDDAPAAQFSVDYDIEDPRRLNPEDDIHLRLTMLGGVDDIALADGVPPRNKPGNPASLKYVIAHNGGENISSLFTSVIEPYKEQRFVRSIAAVPVAEGGVPVPEGSLEVRAVKVELANGRTDYIISALDPSATYTIEGKITFRGAFGVYSELNGQQVYGYVSDGTEIGRTESPLVQAEVGNLSGTIVDVTKELSSENSITVQLDLQGVSAEKLVGRFLYADNDGTRNAAYRIKGVLPLGDGRYKIDIGDITLIRAYLDPNDFSKGFIYDAAEGASFRIPLSAEQSLPVTAASVEGTLKEGWYTDGATVTLEVYHNASNTLRTEYSLDGGTVWTPYSAPAELRESGIYDLLYRSVNLKGAAEQAKSLRLQVDRTPPVTEASVQGLNGADGWYRSNVAVTLQASDAHSGVASTEYTVTDITYGTDSIAGEFIPYIGAIELGEGIYEVSYRSADRAGHAAETKTDTVKVDRTAPGFALQWNGSAASDGMTVDDAEPITLSLLADDNLSGVAAKSVIVDGAPYTEGTVLDWAGKLGTHTIVVTVTDAAGNQASAVYAVTVTATVESLIRLIARYENEGRLTGPLAAQVRNRAEQAKHHAESGRQEQAAKQLEDLLKHLGNEPLEAHIDPRAKAALETDAASIILSLQ